MNKCDTGKFRLLECHIEKEVEGKVQIHAFPSQCTNFVTRSVPVPAVLLAFTPGMRTCRIDFRWKRVAYSAWSPVSDPQYWVSWIWLHRPVISAVERYRQEDQEFKVTLDYVISSTQPGLLVTLSQKTRKTNSCLEHLQSSLIWDSAAGLSLQVSVSAHPIS